ncbi:MAG: metallophosphoesterase [Candidatus Hydrogenedentes bacterium]|nr:metallophosphoesterase [Candidatus Hydrogenedentota bacterium]
MRNRTIFVLSLALLLLISGCATTGRTVEVPFHGKPVPWTSLELNNDPDNFQFAIVSDRAGGERPGVFQSAMGKLNLMQPEFVMSIGDLTEGSKTDVAEMSRQWQEFRDIVGVLEMPFFLVPGNHDIRTSVMAEEWRRQWGPSYYHFRYRDVLFLCLNTEDPPPTHMSDAQIAYMQKALDENADAKWTLVFMHKPLWEFTTEDTGWNRFEPLLKGRNYTVISGHRHNYSKAHRDGHSYFVLATTGGSSKLRGLQEGEFDHIVWVTMTKKGPRIANLLLEGILDEDLK